MYIYIFLCLLSFFCSVLQFWWFLVLDLDGCKIGVLSTYEGSWRLAWNVFLPLRHNAQKAWTVTGAATNSLVACFTTELHGDCIRSIGRTPIKTNFQPRSLALQVIFFFLLWLCQLVVVALYQAWERSRPLHVMWNVPRSSSRSSDRKFRYLRILWGSLFVGPKFHCYWSIPRYGPKESTGTSNDPTRLVDHQEMSTPHPAQLSKHNSELRAESGHNLNRLPHFCQINERGSVSVIQPCKFRSHNYHLISLKCLFGFFSSHLLFFPTSRLKPLCRVQILKEYIQTTWLHEGVKVEMVSDIKTRHI